MSLARREKASVGQSGGGEVFLTAPQGGDRRGTRYKGALCVHVLIASGERAIVRVRVTFTSCFATFPCQM